MTEESEAEGGWQLVVEYPDQSASFVHGVECGKLIARMKAGAVAEIKHITHAENREALRRIADYLGWRIEVVPTSFVGWDFSIFTKVKQEGRRINPQGLQIV
jgi:hypothetical protein